MTLRSDAAERPAWWKEWLEETGSRPAGALRARAEGLSRLLGLESRSRVLDLCCGTGHETLELARRGHRVLGLDVGEDVLRAARAHSKHEKLFCHFVKADIGNLAYTAEFDAVLVRPSAFGRSTKDRDDLRCVQAVRKSLKVGGQVALTLINREWVLRHMGVVDGMRFDLETGRLEASKVPGGGLPTSLRLYSLTEVLRLLRDAGLDFVSAHGRVDGAGYELESAEMIVLAVRPPEAPRAAREDDTLERAVRIKGRGR